MRDCVKHFEEGGNFPLQNKLRMRNTPTQTDCKWCLQSGVATRSIPSCLNGQSGCMILHVRLGSNPVAGTVYPLLHWWCLCIFDVEYVIGNAGAGRQGWKATSMPGTQDLISISMQNGDYTLSAIPQGRTFNEKKKKKEADLPTEQNQVLPKNRKVHYQHSILKYSLVNLHN